MGQGSLQLSHRGTQHRDSGSGQYTQLCACLSLAQSFARVGTEERREKVVALGVGAIRQKEGCAAGKECHVSPPGDVQAVCLHPRQHPPGHCALGAPSRSPVRLQLTPGMMRSETGRCHCSLWTDLTCHSAPGAAPLAPSAESPSFPHRQQAACWSLSQGDSKQRHSCDFLPFPCKCQA